jgi:hypothetical protein
MYTLNTNCAWKLRANYFNLEINAFICHYFCFQKCEIRGASKIKLKKANKTRTVTVIRVIIFLNISKHPLLICLHCCLHQYKTLKAVATVKAAIILLTPAKVFWEFLVVSPLFNHYQGYVQIYQGDMTPKN